MRQLALSIALGGFCLSPITAWADDDDKHHEKPVSHAPSGETKPHTGGAAKPHGNATSQEQGTAHKASETVKNLSDHIHVSNPQDKPVPQSDDSLLEAQRKLEAIIKAAIGHPSIRKTTDEKSAAKGGGKNIIDPNAKLHAYCVDQDNFTIPVEIRVEDYSALTSLKNSIVVGPDKVDIKQVRALVLNYIGLGFGDEAQDFSTYLGGYNRRVLSSMGRAVSGLVLERDVKTLGKQAECWPEAKLWVEFTKVQLVKGFDDIGTPKQSAPEAGHGTSHGHDEDPHTSEGQEKPVSEAESGIFYPSKKDIQQMDALPKTLAGLMAKRFGLHAIRHGNLDSAGKMMDFLNGEHKRKGVAHVFDQEADFLQANWFLSQNNPRAVTILTRLSQRDGPFQVPSLKLLSNLKIEKGQALYSGFEQDLEGAAHIFEHHPEGKEVLAQKINLFVANDHLDQAIGMTKEKFEPDDYYYGTSALRISERLQIHLKGDQEERKLHALNTLIREQIFFDALVDGFPLKSAGIGASLDLGLAELAPKILPTQQWSKLDLHILQEMAIALPDDLKTHLPQKAFDTDEIRAQKIASELLSGDPKSAMRELRKDPTNKVLVQAAADHSFQKGYWSMARDNIKSLQKAVPSSNNDNEAGEPDTKTDLSSDFSVPISSPKALQVKGDLAAALSVPSPHLTAKTGAQTIGDLTVLQTFLDGDLEMMKGYINHE